jgi:hypothetical protein
MNLTEILYGILGLALLILLVYLAVYWLTFPVQVSKKLDELIDELKRTNFILESRRSNEARNIEMPPVASGYKPENPT